VVRAPLAVSRIQTGRQLRTSWLSAAAYAGMFAFGIVMALLGAVLPLLAERVHFDLAHAGDLFLVMNAAMLVTTFAVGPLVDRFGHKPALMIAPLWVGAALAILSRAVSFRDLLFAVICLGIGGGALNQVTNTLIADLYDDVYKKSAALNILGVFFGFGALFIPFAIGSLLRLLGLAQILYIALVLSLVAIVLSIPFTFPEPRQRGGVSFGNLWHLLHQPLVLTFSFLLFFESGNEFVLGGYLSTYMMRDLRATVATASYLLALYWGALMLGRIVLSRAALRISGAKLILASASGVAISVGLLLSMHSLTLAPLFVFVAGFSTAAIFPAALGLAGARYASHSGTVFGVLIGIALAGGMILPWAVGRIASAVNLTSGLVLVISDAVAIIVLNLVSKRLQ
jgi:FHS family glucose/mannose:H+ symporter-like MFS transporter